jgi:hypothetical protein
LTAPTICRGFSAWRAARKFAPAEVVLSEDMGWVFNQQEGETQRKKIENAAAEKSRFSFYFRQLPSTCGNGVDGVIAKKH